LTDRLRLLISRIAAPQNQWPPHPKHGACWTRQLEIPVKYDDCLFRKRSADFREPLVTENDLERIRA
jgi:hypothetical protein